MCLLHSKILVKNPTCFVNIVTIFRGCIYGSFYSYYARPVCASSLYWLCDNILSIYLLLCRTCLCHVRLRTQQNMTTEGTIYTTPEDGYSVNRNMSGFLLRF